MAQAAADSGLVAVNTDDTILSSKVLFNEQESVLLLTATHIICREFAGRRDSTWRRTGRRGEAGWSAGPDKGRARLEALDHSHSTVLRGPSLRALFADPLCGPCSRPLFTFAAPLRGPLPSEQRSCSRWTSCWACGRTSPTRGRL